MNDASWTVRRMLQWMAEDFESMGVESARLDAELLLGHALEIDRVRLYMDMDRPLSALELAELRALVKRRRQREPVAYILGKREFYLRELEVNEDVLVPRPETELLVDRALDGLPMDVEARALDLCTGSGCVAITLAAERAGLQMDAVDISAEALSVARRNGERHDVGGRVAWHLGDLYAALPGAARYDLITANPPYVSEAEWAALPDDVSQHEPPQALLAGPDGLSVLRGIAAGAPGRLGEGGRLLVEMGASQGAAVRALLAEALPTARILVHRDLAGHERIVEANLAPESDAPPQEPGGKPQ